MALALGPILGFRGRQEDRWKVCALLVLDDGDGEPRLTWSAPGGATGDSATSDGASVRKLKSLAGRTVWCADWSVAMAPGDLPTTVTYRFGEAEADFEVPGRDTKLRLAYTSCNGFAHPKYMKQVDVPNRLWHRVDSSAEADAVRGVRQSHEEAPFHLLLMGGDQLYADSIWEVVTPLQDWLALPAEKRYRLSFTKTMAKRTERFYFDLYLSRWSQPEVAHMLARVPTLMMWDDHDIFDGWGSYPDEQQSCDVYQGIFRLAREAFEVFQQKVAPGERPPGVLENTGGFTSVFGLGDIALAVLDLRSERTPRQIMGRQTWDALLQAQDSLEGVRHLLVMSSIPLVYLDLSVMERALAWVPGQQSLEDDLLDHWRARPHRIERLRLIHRLLSIGRDDSQRCRVTLLSGDVHVGALGAVASKRDDGGRSQVIHQLISSGIVHPPPPKVVVYAFEHMAEKVEEVDRGIEARLLPFPGTDRRLIGTRNWLSLVQDDQDRLWASWHAEGAEKAFTKVIQPI